MGTKFSWILLGFWSTIIYEVLYAWCFRYNICNSWILYNTMITSTCLWSLYVHLVDYVLVYVLYKPYTVANCVDEFPYSISLSYLCKTLAYLDMEYLGTWCFTQDTLFDTLFMCISHNLWPDLRKPDIMAHSKIPSIMHYKT